jgi:glycosyltransferase involved in cell wall biosynthesis
VQDRYEGTAAKTFAECTDAEISAYLQANVGAVRELAERVQPDIALANHLVMGPVILARALGDETPYAVKVHGSALEYTVKTEPERFLGFAREGLAKAKTVLVGSKHTAESLWRALGEEDGEAIKARTHLGPPGVDVEHFVPLAPQDAEVAIGGLLERLSHTAPQPIQEQASAFARDDRMAIEALQRISSGEGVLVAYVGKLIVSKGVDLLVAAWPLVLCSIPDARLMIVGFGSYREGLERMIEYLVAGDLEGAKQLAHAGRSLEAGDGAHVRGDAAPLRHLLAFLDSLSGEAEMLSGEVEMLSGEVEIDRQARPPGASSAKIGGQAELASASSAKGGGSTGPYLAAARLQRERVVFTGRLDHEELADVLPSCDSLVVPSTFPEAFGMVAAEAAACGVLPVSAAHSGLAEVSERIAEVVPGEASAWLSFPVDDDAVRAIAERLVGWLQDVPDLMGQTRDALV